MEKISFADAQLLKAKLKVSLRSNVSAVKLAEKIFVRFEKTIDDDLIVGARTIWDYHQRHDAQSLVRLNSTYPARLLEAISIIELEENVGPDIRDQARRFFATDQDSYNYENLDRFVGTYDMFRPYWIELGSPDFMRSRVRILRRGAHFLFSEFQRWPHKPFLEVSAGYLFPSRNSIIAICKSRSGRHVKFLSIGSLRQDPKNFENLERFSGSLIATSDEPPHPGHGFCCVRNDESKRESNFISRKEMMKKVVIYNSIMINQIHSEMDINEYKEFKSTNFGE